MSIADLQAVIRPVVVVPPTRPVVLAVDRGATDLHVALDPRVTLVALAGKIAWITRADECLRWILLEWLYYYYYYYIIIFIIIITTRTSRILESLASYPRLTPVVDEAGAPRAAVATPTKVATLPLIALLAFALLGLVLSHVTTLWNNDNCGINKQLTINYYSIDNYTNCN